MVFICPLCIFYHSLKLKSLERVCQFLNVIVITYQYLLYWGLSWRNNSILNKCNKCFMLHHVVNTGGYKIGIYFRLSDASPNKMIIYTVFNLIGVKCSIIETFAHFFFILQIVLTLRPFTITLTSNKILLGLSEEMWLWPVMMAIN